MAIAITAAALAAVTAALFISTATATTGGTVSPWLQPNPSLVASGDITVVDNLPGWNPQTPMPCELYSGFVGITATVPSTQDMKMHYMLYGQQGPDGSAGGTTADSPIIVWYSGGPGAPSSWATFIENGPLLTNEQSWTLPTANITDGLPGLVLNPYAWTRFAAVLAFANPPPTGFSHCTPPGPTGNGSACGNWNDTRVGVVNAQAIDIVLRQHFPQLVAAGSGSANRPIYIIGESYAGVYISALVDAISSDQQYAVIGSHIAGVALGDACMGTAQICGGNRGPGDWLSFLHGHGQFPTILWKQILSTCSDAELRWGHVSAACSALVQKAQRAAGNYYVYNLYDDCPNNMFEATAVRRKVPSAIHRRHLAPETVGMLPRRRHAAESRRHQRALAAQSGATSSSSTPSENFNGYWCPGHVFVDYMNRTDVRRALGVPLDANFFIEDDAVGMRYDLTLTDGFAIFAALLRNKTTAGGASTITRPFRLLSYNGDADAAVVQTDGRASECFGSRERCDATSPDAFGCLKMDGAESETLRRGTPLNNREPEAAVEAACLIHAGWEFGILRCGFGDEFGTARRKSPHDGVRGRPVLTRSVSVGAKGATVVIFRLAAACF